MTRTVLYLCGPMTGIPDMNRPAFLKAEEELTAAGFIVLNPARLPVGMNPDQYMPICLAMLQQADGMAVLPGSHRSRGAYVEAAYADYQKKRCRRIDDWMYEARRCAERRTEWEDGHL